MVKFLNNWRCNLMINKNEKTGVLVNMSKELKAELLKIAKKDNRTLTSLINKVLMDFVAKENNMNK